MAAAFESAAAASGGMAAGAAAAAGVADVGVVCARPADAAAMPPKTSASAARAMELLTSVSRLTSCALSMPEVPPRRHEERHVALVGGGDDLLVSDRAARRDDGGHARVGEDLEPVAEREERI